MRRMLPFLAGLIASVGPAVAQTPVGTAFTYQGRLTDGGGSANGSYDFRFTLFDAPSGGNPVGAPVAVGAVPVLQGLFTATLDFGAPAFQGQARWLGIEVQPAGGSGYTTLTPRQPLTPGPHAVFSSFTDPANLTALDAGNLSSGTVPGPRLSGTYSLALTLTNPANALTGTFSGNGAAITSLNASSLASGTVPSGVVSGTYGNAVTFPNTANAFTGDGSGLTNLDAQPKYVRTTVVSPVGTLQENGTALLAALAGITTASDVNPWLLKIEPGIYDVGTTSFVMKPFVDVEGSGETATRITGQGSASNSVGTVQAVSNSELRFLTVANTGGAPYAKPLFVDGAAPRISHVTALGSGGSVESQGFFAQNGASPTATDLTAVATATGAANSFAVLNISGSAGIFFGLNVNAVGGGVSRAIANFGGASPAFRNVVATASGATTENQGVSSYDSSPSLENVVAVATGAATNNLGCLNLGSANAASMRHVTCRGLGATGINYGNLNNIGAQPTIVDLVGDAAGGMQAHALENNGAGAGLSVTRAVVSASGGGSESIGLYITGCSPRVVGLVAFAGATGAAAAYGIKTLSASPTLDHVTSTAGGETGTVAGILNDLSTATVVEEAIAIGSGGNYVYGVYNAGVATLTNVTASASGGAFAAYGVANVVATASLTNVVATGTGVGASAFGIGVYNIGASGKLVNVTAAGGGTGGGRYGMYNNSGSTPNTVTLDRSTLTGVTASFSNQLGTTRIASSQLAGPVATAGGATTTCLLSYSGPYLVLNGVCQ